MKIDEKIDKHLANEGKNNEYDDDIYYEASFTYTGKGKVEIYIDNKEDAKKFAEQYIHGDMNPHDEAGYIDSFTEKKKINSIKLKEKRYV